MIRTLDRYLLRSFFINYVLSLFVLISLYVVLDLFVNFDEFTEAGKSVFLVLQDICDYYFYNLPLYFSQLSGIITLFAACATLARMQKQNELTAVLSSGTSMYRLAAPIVLAGLLMNGLLILDHEVILPKVGPKLVRERDDVQGARVYNVWCVREGEGRVMSALKFSPQKEMIRCLIVIEYSTDPADRGQMRNLVAADIAQWDPANRGWELISRGRRSGVKLDSRGGLSGDSSIITKSLKFYPSELAPEQLLLRQQAQWIQFLSLRQLDQLRHQGGVDLDRIASVKHCRFTTPINNMILLLLGISFFMSRLPEGVLAQGAKAVATCSICFVVSFAGQYLIGSGDFSPALPTWLPIFLFGPLAVVLLDNVKT
ncbi:MAG: LptF/LptG family permease [Planctomycetota bacterium]|jgi:lipopolysaccharide export LptBFGC system permease protein LptF